MGVPGAARWVRRGLGYGRGRAASTTAPLRRAVVRLASAPAARAPGSAPVGCRARGLAAGTAGGTPRLVQYSPGGCLGCTVRPGRSAMPGYQPPASAARGRGGGSLAHVALAHRPRLATGRRAAGLGLRGTAGGRARPWVHGLCHSPAPRASLARPRRGPARCRPPAPAGHPGPTAGGDRWPTSRPAAAEARGQRGLSCGCGHRR